MAGLVRQSLPRGSTWILAQEKQKSSADVDCGSCLKYTVSVAKLHSAQVLEILERIEQGQSRQAIAQAFGVSRQTLSHIALGETWSQLTGRGRAIRTPRGKSHFGRRVGEVMAQRGLSVRWLATQVGCAKTTVRYITLGDHEPHLDRALAIAEALEPYASREFLLWGE